MLQENNINHYCNNCGKCGHLFHQCKLPINSYGMIVFTYQFKDPNIITNEKQNIYSEMKISRKKEETENKEIKFLMIRRKNSFGYIDFIRGKYSPKNIVQIQNIINEMSLCEKKDLLDSYFQYKQFEMELIKEQTSNFILYSQQNTEPIKSLYTINNSESVLFSTHIKANALKTNNTNESVSFEKNNIQKCKQNKNNYDLYLKSLFDILWKDMWNIDNNITNKLFHKNEKQHKSEKENSFIKYCILMNGFMLNGEWIDIKYFIIKSHTNWTETEWEFPKGRRNFPKEKEVDCALREFEEETGISKTKLHIIENCLPYEEIFIGTNHKSYKHKYFLAYIKNEIENENNMLIHFEKNEVSKIEYKTIQDCIESIRPYHYEKKQIIEHIFSVLSNFLLYQKE